MTEAGWLTLGFLLGAAATGIAGYIVAQRLIDNFMDRPEIRAIATVAQVLPH